MATVKLDPAKGIQIPNLTTTERNAISSPETGAIIWNTTTSEINQYNGSAWEITYTDTNTQIAGITSSADATAITINSSENVGIGVVPEVTHPSHDALQLGGNGNWSSYGTQGASGEMDFQHNAYYAADGNDKYISTDEATKYRQGGGVHRFYTAPSGSADAAITFTQKVRIDSDGLKFNSDTAANNALDDYEEGTYAGTLTPASGSLALYSGHDTLSYTKIGRMVHVQGKLTVQTNSSATGATHMNLPFTVGSFTDSADRPGCVTYGYFNAGGLNGSYTVLWEWTANTNQVRVYVKNSVSGAVNVSDYSGTGADVFVNIMYEVD